MFSSSSSITQPEERTSGLVLGESSRLFLSTKSAPLLHAVTDDTTSRFERLTKESFNVLDVTSNSFGSRTGPLGPILRGTKNSSKEANLSPELT